MKLKYYIKLFLFLGLLMLVSCTSKEISISCGINEATQTGVNHLKKLTDAMEKYKKETGKYPNNVIDLIPQYVEKLPIINSNSEGFDPTKYDILISDNLQASGPFISNDGKFFSFRLYPKDERICLLGGRNNICEYSSDKPFWNCHQ